MGWLNIAALHKMPLSVEITTSGRAPLFRLARLLFMPRMSQIIGITTFPTLGNLIAIDKIWQKFTALRLITTTVC